MPAAQLPQVDQLQQYIQGVMDRAAHHAQGVSAIALALAGAIVWRKDGATSIEAYTRAGNVTNVLWVHIGGKRYAFSYNHVAGTIELREGTLQGNVLHSFSNATPLATVETVFRSL